MVADDPLQTPCYAAFLDPSVAILVRSTGQVSEMIARTSRSPLDGYENTSKLMDTIECRRMIKENPSLKDMSLKPLFDVERIGLGAFKKIVGPKTADGLPEEANPPNPSTTKIPWSKTYRQKSTAGKESQVRDLKLEDLQVVKDDGSWGIVSKEDPRVWLTIV